MAVVVLLFVTGLMIFEMQNARRGPAGSGLDRRTRAMLVIPIVVMWTVAIMFSLVALTPLILRNGQFPIPAFVLLLIPIAAVAASIWWVARASAEPDDLPADNTPDECWKWGQLYYNPNDPSLLVEKRFGLGYTLNFARWGSWVLLAAVLVLPLVVILIARH